MERQLLAARDILAISRSLPFFKNTEPRTNSFNMVALVGAAVIRLDGMGPEGGDTARIGLSNSRSGCLRRRHRAPARPERSRRPRAQAPKCETLDQCMMLPSGAVHPWSAGIVDEMGKRHPISKLRPEWQFPVLMSPGN